MSAAELPTEYGFENLPNPKPAHSAEHVLIQTGTNPRNGSKVYHKPDPENPTEPSCVRFPTDDEWLRKDPELLPNHRMCKDCSGESKRGAGGRSDLHLQLEQMDPEDVGGSA